MLAATTAPAGLEVWTLLSNAIVAVLAAGVGAAVAAWLTYRAITKAYRQHLVDRERMTAYFDLGEYFRKLRHALNNWPRSKGDVLPAAQRILDHCGDKKILLSAIAPEIVGYYKARFKLWHREALRRGVDKEGIQGTINICEEFQDKIAGQMRAIFPIKGQEVIDQIEQFEKQSAASPPTEPDA